VEQSPVANGNGNGNGNGKTTKTLRQVEQERGDRQNLPSGRR
jgi:hypothetical protein